MVTRHNVTLPFFFQGICLVLKPKYETFQVKSADDDSEDEEEEDGDSDDEDDIPGLI